LRFRRTSESVVADNVFAPILLFIPLLARTDRANRRVERKMGERKLETTFAGYRWLRFSLARTGLSLMFRFSFGASARRRGVC